MGNIVSFGFPIQLAYTLSVAIVEAMQGGRDFVGKNDLKRLLEWYQSAVYPYNATLFSRGGESDEGQALYILMRRAHGENAVNGVRRRSPLFDRVVEFVKRFPRETYSHHDAYFVLNFFNDLASGIRKYRISVKRRKTMAVARGTVARLKNRREQARA